MTLNKYESYVLFLILKLCKNPNPGDAQLRDISLATRHPSYQSKTDTIFKINTIGCYSFQGSLPVCFSLSRVETISVIN